MSEANPIPSLPEIMGDEPILIAPIASVTTINARVTGVKVRCRKNHEHDGRRYPAGSEFAMSPETAELAAARGDVKILSLNEEEIQQ